MARKCKQLSETAVLNKLEKKGDERSIAWSGFTTHPCNFYAVVAIQHFFFVRPFVSYIQNAFGGFASSPWTIF
jgi:hypothetical protein